MESQFKTNADLSKVNIQVSKIDDAIDRTAYTSMKTCFTCGTIIGKTGLKKFYCHFCYKGFCSACLPETVLHPETRVPEKTCYDCFTQFIKAQVLEVGCEYVVFRLDKEINLRESALAKTVQLRSEIEAHKEFKKKLKQDHDKEVQRKRNYLYHIIEKFEEADIDLDTMSEYMHTLFNHIASEDGKTYFQIFLDNLIV